MTETRRRQSLAAARQERPAPAGLALKLDEQAQRIVCAGQVLALTRYEFLLLATLLRRPRASSKATRDTRSISAVV